MLRQTLLLVCLYFWAGSSLLAQNVRTIDGTMNNLQEPDWGAAEGDVQYITTVSFSDGISAPTGTNRPNPRIISNALFAQDTTISDVLNLSDFTWVFGQFMDHDLIASPNNPTESANIAINFVDPWMNPSGLFLSFIPMTRSMEMSGTGTSTANPRGYFNAITAWVDGSGVYGSDHERADWLRTFSGGKLKTSAGNLLPFNTTTGEVDGPTDPNAPEMDNENPFNDRLFVAGDTRANENPSLTSFHTVFVREHNRLCDVFAAENPDWSDEQLYQKARKMVGAYIQSIVYNEWLPAMGIDLLPYQGYNSDLNPNISNVFATAAFRMGHTLLNSTIRRRDGDGLEIPEGDITLRDAFFNPLVVLNEGGIDPIFKGMSSQIQQDLDVKVVDDVRNFLFGPPGSGGGGLDLAAININRGRDRGLADFNTIRRDLGLTPYTSYSQICSDTSIVSILENLYGSVDNVDAWVGMLAENHMANALVGETIMEILKFQFGNLREGDRFFYENDPGLTDAEKDEIHQTRMRDILMRNTGIKVMQRNVFLATEHDSICPAYNLEENITGTIAMENGTPIENVSVEIEGNGVIVPLSSTTDSGNFGFVELPSCEAYTLTPTRDGSHRNGVTTFDIILTNKHILDVQELGSPYQMLAADVNLSGSITTFDIVLMRKLVLNIDNEFPGNTAWQFVDADYTFTNPTDPFNENYPKEVTVNSLTQEMELNFVAIKNGDVNSTANPANFEAPEDRSGDETLTFQASDQTFKAGEIVKLTFQADEFSSINGYQFTLDYNTDALEFVQVEAGVLPALGKENFGVFAPQGKITTSWNGSVTVDKQTDLFIIEFRAKQAGKLSELITLNSDLTIAEAYTTDLERRNVSLVFSELKPEAEVQNNLVLLQNRPNPFQGMTTIGFILPEASSTQLNIFDLSGKVIFEEKADYAKGYHEVNVQVADLLASGAYYYQLSTDKETLSNRMIVVDQSNR